MQSRTKCKQALSFTEFVSMEAMRAKKAALRAAAAQPGTGAAHQRAGADYAPGAILVTHCACCKAQMTIVPRNHPYYIRRDDGTVAWLCGGCFGTHMQGENKHSFLRER